ncbi:prepilin-type N-terminal cleavage/methylation domain-containing protein [Haloferula chungangensis]|uniref:Prepilin-type N-terminal cleavage/methylation domain-containing protein n=1 Tax=Haloferula chungangensis TaxID=1048331 RepID=A0ABW2LA94_9BACT
MNKNRTSVPSAFRASCGQTNRPTIHGCPRARAGFTLTELLVVIVIIVSLAALLFPLANRIRKKAESAACMSNLRQLTSVAFAYASDNNGEMPMPTEAAGILTWPDTLASGLGKERPFLAEQSVKCCPTQFRIFPQSRTYAINRQIDAKRQGATANGAETRPAKLIMFSRPGGRGTSLSEIPYFMDGSFTSNWKVHRAWPESEANEKNFPHDGYCNMSFLDGHAEATRAGEGIWAERSKFNDGSPTF